MKKIMIMLGLNPCFNGRYSQSSNISYVSIIRTPGLNPCFNGRYSQSYTATFDISRVCPS